MRERAELLLKLACLALAALVLYQLSRFMTRTSPLEHLGIPALPSLSSGSNAPIAEAVTNSIPAKETEKKGTNSVAGKEENKPGTNAVSTAEAANKSTNAAAGPASGKPETNALASQEPKDHGTNSTAKKEPANKETNSVPAQASAGPKMHAMPPSGPGNAAPDLPPLVQARIERITQSEILGQVMHPLPMALLGIAGKTAFMRAPNGQTGLMKAGEDLGGIKLVRIGINRVLVDENGQNKELTIFSGFGGETLMPQSKQNPNETITKTP